MATARKLPSGSWRCQVFDRYEVIRQPDGSEKKKRIYKSFTSDDPSRNGKKARRTGRCTVGGHPGRERKNAG